MIIKPGKITFDPPCSAISLTDMIALREAQDRDKAVMAVLDEADAALDNQGEDIEHLLEQSDRTEQVIKTLKEENDRLRKQNEYLKAHVRSIGA